LHNAALIHVSSQDPSLVLLELHASLKPGGVLFSSNPRSHNEEGWDGGRYGMYHELETCRRYTIAGSARSHYPEKNRAWEEYS
jgi:2-polyprenyl-3-methyl-5-hydroxy-6-metoxy-1,4-benzoquinol methylase